MPETNSLSVDLRDPVTKASRDNLPQEDYLLAVLHVAHTESEAAYAACEADDDLVPCQNCLGMRLMDITYSMKYFQPGPDANDATKPATHQHVWRPQTPGNRTFAVGWTEVATTGKTQPYPAASNLSTQTPSVNVYDYGDFPTLFRPPQPHG